LGRLYGRGAKEKKRTHLLGNKNKGSFVEGEMGTEGRKKTKIPKLRGKKGSPLKK